MPTPASLDFGTLLRARRIRCGLSGAELARRARMQQPQYSDYENGNRKVGSKVAERLADALGLKDFERDEFIHSALLTGRRPRIGESFQFYHPAILESVANRLRRKAITPTMIFKALMRPLFMTGDEAMLRGIERLAHEMQAKAQELLEFVKKMRDMPHSDEPQPIPTDLMVTLNSGTSILVDVTVAPEE